MQLKWADPSSIKRLETCIPAAVCWDRREQLGLGGRGRSRCADSALELRTETRKLFFYAYMGHGSEIGEKIGGKKS